MQTTQLSAPPSLGRLYVRAAGRAATDAVVRRRRPRELPDRQVVVTGHRIPAEAVTAWRGAVGSADPADLPSVLVLSLIHI